MSTTTMTTPPPSTPGPTPAQDPGAGRRNGAGAAVHQDLYRKAVDPAVEREELAGQARILGLGFFIFGLVITSLSVAVNGGFSKVPVFAVTVPEGSNLAHATTLIGTPKANQVLWSNLETTTPLRVEPTPAGSEQVHIDPEKEVGIPLWISGPSIAPQEREAFTIVAAKVPDATVKGLKTAGAQARGVPRLVHGIRVAKLFRTVPTHYFMSVCAMLGLLGALTPVLLIPFYKFWMRWVAAPLGWFNTRLILSIFFFIMLTPVALIFAIKRLMNPHADPLRRAPQPAGTSYWKTRAQQRARTHFERPF